MKVRPTTLPGVVVVEPVVHRDPRGFFLETYHRRRYEEHGIDAAFVQDNHSASVKDTLRGLHLQATRLQAKLLRVMRGAIFDVAVDVREGSPTFGCWTGETLSDENHHQLYIPAGFAHGFCVLSDRAEVAYKCSDYYVADDEIAIAWNDSDIGVEWPVAEPILSERDRRAPPLAELAGRLPRYAG